MLWIELQKIAAKFLSNYALVSEYWMIYYKKNGVFGNKAVPSETAKTGISDITNLKILNNIIILDEHV